MSTNHNTTILYCHCEQADILPAATKTAVLEQLTAAGVTVEAVPDLCKLAARRDPSLVRHARADNLRIAACYPRAVKWLFHAAAAPLSDSAQILNMRTQSAAEITAALLDNPTEPTGATALEQCPPSVGAPSLSAAEGWGTNRPGTTALEQCPTTDTWLPWFPVIDYDRCTNCKQCLSFCLFGVYNVDDRGRITVQEPANCKTGCPACARVCPEVAIVFPKYAKSPINGDEVREEHLTTEPVKVDVAAALGGDIHTRLRQRGRRFAPDSQQPADTPCGIDLQKMQAQLEIPDDVLRDLPSTCSCKCKSGSTTPSPTPPDDKPRCC